MSQTQTILLALAVAALTTVGCRPNTSTHAHTNPTDRTVTIVIAEGHESRQVEQWQSKKPLIQLLEDQFAPRCEIAVQSSTHEHALQIFSVGIDWADQLDQQTDRLTLDSAVGQLTFYIDHPDAVEGQLELTTNPDLQEKYPRITGELSQEQAIQLILLDVDSDYLNLLTANEHDVTWQQVTHLYSRGVTAEFVTAMRQARSTPIPSLEPPQPRSEMTPLPVSPETPEPFSVDEIVYLSQRGIDAEFVESMQAAGYRFNANELYYLKSRGISAEFAGRWREIGSDLSHEQLYYLKSRGINADDAQQFFQAGYDPDPQELHYLKSRGISAEFAADWRNIGYDLSHQDLYYLKSRGIDSAYARELREAGYDLSPQQLYYLKSRGIDASYAKQLAQPGLEPLTPEQLYKIKSHGVDPAMIHRLRTPAGP